MGGGGGCETEECGPRMMGAAATRRQLFVAKGGSGTRGAGSSAFSRGCITPGCYWNCPDFGMTLQAKHNTPVGCMEPEGLPVCDPWLTAAPPTQTGSCLRAGTLSAISISDPQHLAQCLTHIKCSVSELVEHSYPRPQAPGRSLLPPTGTLGSSGQGPHPPPTSSCTHSLPPPPRCAS